MKRTYVGRGEPAFILEIFEGEKKILDEKYNTNKCCICGREVSRNYRVFYEDEKGNKQDVTINREGGLCRRCAIWDLLYGLDPDATAPERVLK
ncbi:MAG: hypothetical protein ABIF10_04125 [Candidatus Woesearchaeota archaeon]